MGGGDQEGRNIPDFENTDLLTLIDEVCGTYFEFRSYF